MIKLPMKKKSSGALLFIGYDYLLEQLLEAPAFTP